MKQGPNVPYWLFAGLTGIFAIFTGWFALETWLLSDRKRHPETYYIRNAVSWAPGKTVLICAALTFALGAAWAHFIADDELNPR